MATLTTTRRKFSFSTNRVNLLLDVSLVLLFIVELEEHFTGLRNHELIGLLMGALFIVHLILHWKWIVSITRTFFKTPLHESRLNYILNIGLFVDMLVIIVTGIFISRTLGLSLDVGGANWERIHILASELSLVIVALHVALHWKWLATQLGRLLPTRRQSTPKQSVAVQMSRLDEPSVS